METTEDIIVEKVACDWLTLATWEGFQLAEVGKWLEAGDRAEPTPGRWLQYRGSRGENWFTGGALQDEMEHHLAWISGPLADDALRHFAPRDAFTDGFSKCTRMDVQLTLPDWKRKWSLTRAADRLERGRMGEWLNVPGAGPNITYWHSKDGDTVYIGSRQNGIMARVYQKEAQGQRFIRVEFEYKASRARALYNSCKDSATLSMESALAAEINAWPQGWREYLAPFAAWAEGRKGLRPSILKAKTTDARRLEWLRRIAPTLGNLALSESVGAEARVELLRILFPTA